MPAVERFREMLALKLVLGALLLVGGGGCIMHGRCVHDPPLAKNVSRIVRGQTTQAQVLEYFGVPDFEVRGTTATLREDSMLGKRLQQMRQNLQRMSASLARIKVSTGQAQPNCTTQEQSPGARFDEMLGMRAYSSIDDNHFAYLYEESDESFVAGMTFGLPITIGGADCRVRTNRLLLLINRHTNVVDEFGYRGEFITR